MATTQEKVESRPVKGSGIYLSLKSFVILILIIAALGSCITIWLITRDSAAESSTKSLVAAYSKRRLIEPRLSGGFRAGEYDSAPDDLTNIDTSKLDDARSYIFKAIDDPENNQAWHAYARMLIAGRQTDKAIALLRPLAADPNASAEVHNDYGACLFEQGKMEEAIDEFGRAIEKEPKFQEALFNRSVCYQKLQLRDAARDELQNLIRTERDQGWAKEIRQRLEAMSRPLTPQRSYEEIYNAFDAAVENGRVDEARTIADQNFETVRRHVLIHLAEEYLQTALAGDQAGADRAMSKLELIGRVGIETRKDREVAAIADYLRKLPKAEWAVQLALLERYVGAVRDFEARRFPAAQAAIEPLRKEFRDSANHPFELQSDLFLAQCYYIGKRYKDSIDILIDALSRTEGADWHYYQAKLLTQIAIGYSFLGQDALAIKYCEEAAKLIRNAPDLQAKISQFVSFPYWHLGDLDTALARLRDSTNLYLEYEALPNRFANLAANYSQLASVYSLRKRPDLALRYAEQALGYADQAQDKVYGAEFSSFAAVEYARLERREQAEAALNRAFEYLDKIETSRQHESAEASLLTNAGEVAVKNGDVERALDYYKKAEALAALDEGKIIPKIDVLRGRAGAYAASGHRDEARASLQRAATLIDGYRENIDDRNQRSNFLAASQSVFDQLISLDSRSPGFLPEAFESSERSRARALLDEISPAVKGSRAVDTKQGSGGSGHREPVKPLTLAQVQSELSPDLTLLEYSVTDEATYAFLVTRAGIEGVELPAGTDKLDRQVHEYVSDIIHRAPIEEVNQKAKELYRILFEPVAGRLNGSRNICIVPDKALHFLPFATLIDGSGNYLAETYCLTHAPSASVLIRCIQQNGAKPLNRPERMFAVGNPEFNRDRFPDLLPLADAESEAAGAASLYTSDSLVLNGAAATEPSVRAAIKQFDVAHLALHCLVKENSPWLAALVLAPTNADRAGPRHVGASQQAFVSDSNDGMLYLDEVYEIKLPQTRLVVLSACQSGLGRYYRGEGMVSLARPFLAAGVPTVATSLWPVNSEATSQLMIEFHRQRKLSQLGSADALSKAQVMMARNSPYQHPYYWGSFIVIGINN
jgi:CHAT domain-containing protein/lipopolysaccharide biosynthesis regulator YciM